MRADTVESTETDIGDLLQGNIFSWSPCMQTSGTRFVFAPLALNATHQARRRAGARDERTLFAAACMRLFGQA